MKRASNEVFSVLFRWMLYFIAFIILLWALKGRYFLRIFIILVFGFMYAFDKIVSKVKDELFWISSSFMSEERYGEYKDESSFYDFMRLSLEMGKIKKGMTVDAIKEFIEKEDKKNSEDGVKTTHAKYYQDKICWVYFSDEDERNAKIPIDGYGYGIPTPRITLKFIDRKLFSWKV